jgi:hypothetical protein
MTGNHEPARGHGLAAATDRTYAQGKAANRPP